ncbi:methyl-accepting chemotaxis protein [hydrocarbon metagenome]|uniref:Methyl-accepting chemotaxis protein n=1 Tax=hydrocarbon metagenome TaxID=938273 RepID=A0A0W8G5P6_9ZZZZ
MRAIKNLRIGLKLGLGFAAVSGVFILLVVIQMRSVDRLGELQDESMRRSSDAVRIMETAARLQSLYTIAADAIINRNFKETEKDLRDYKQEMQKDLVRLAEIVDTPEERADLQKFEKTYDGYFRRIETDLVPFLKNVRDQADQTAELEEKIEEIRLNREEAIGLLEKILASLRAESVEAEEAFEAVRARAETDANVYSAVAVAVAVLLAVWITLGIVRPLSRVRRFAGELAAGNLDGELDIRQNDEVGQVARAMGQVAGSLRALMAEFEDVARDVSLGRLTRRADAARFTGAYATLLEGANGLAGVLTGYLDNMPMPAMTVDGDLRILFMNKAGAALGNISPQQLSGTRCQDHFRTGDCGTPQCAGKRAIQSRAAAVSETEAHPAAADMDIRYDAVPILDTAGRVVGAFEVVSDQTEIRSAQRTMRRLAQNADEIAKRLSVAADDLTRQVEESGQGARVQRDRAEETATSMEEMNATVLEVAKNAAEASRLTEETRSKARRGAEVVEAAVAAIGQVETRAKALRDNMAGLGRQAESIGNILGVISDIADQTNLLALNAAIEAARAGDAGRGFAVVADEVRKLAEKTMQATDEVGQAITAIQNAAQVSVEESRLAAEAVEKSAALAKESGEALAGIVHMAENAADQVQGIATASEQQSSASEEVTRATEEINRISTQTAQAMDASMTAITELSGLAGRLEQLIAEMNA